MSTRKNTKVLIAGGSIAGLTLANILEQLGIDYLVLEKYRKIAPDLGASIGIFPNGFRILDQIGCYDDIKALVKGADSFETLCVRDENGRVVIEAKDASKKFIDRLGYEPIFIDRQMTVQILYNNLRDKSKVLAGQGVVKVEQTADEVKVTTESGEIFHSDILVGCDGIHSSVRREMWRLADEDSPNHFPVNERSNVPTEYCCIFGISKPTDKFPKYYSQNTQGRDHSYLVATGPNHCIYWFLFRKLPKTTYGLYEKIPRYTDQERDSLAAENAADHITDTLTFGELYAMRTTATLQALPEVVFKRWTYKRIMIIGDAAHKFNPIGGQGGNSAIEDAAVLANQLQRLFDSEHKTDGVTEANVIQAFQETQRIRFDRANKLLKMSHNLQSVQAMDTFSSKLIGKYILPLSSGDQIIQSICSDSHGAARVKALPMPERPHRELWDDERPPNPIGWKRLWYVAFVSFTVLVVSAVGSTQSPVAFLPKVLLNIEPKA